MKDYDVDVSLLLLSLVPLISVVWNSIRKKYLSYITGKFTIIIVHGCIVG